MAAAAAIRARIMNQLYGLAQAERPFVSRINGAYTAGAGTCIVDDGAKFTAGDIIEFADGTQLLVESISTHTLTVVATNGTTDTSQLDNALISRNPRFTIFDVDNVTTEIMQALAQWNIFAFGEGTITTVANQDWYDLTDTDILENIGVLTLMEIETNTLTPNPLPFQYWNHIHTTVSATGHGLQTWDHGNTAVGGTLYYTYAKVIAATTDLSTRQEEIVVLGAVARMMGHDIAPRTMDPGKTTDRTNQPGQVGRDSRWFLAEYQRAAWREEARLAVEVSRFKRSTREIARLSRWTL
jgi:hypothetical protein